MRFLRRQRRQRGTAMTELVIIAPFFVMAWAAINHFRNTFIMEQQVLHESRTHAWARATSGNCDHGLTPSVLLADDWGSFGGEALAAFEILPGNGSILKGTATVDVHIARPGPSPSKVYGFLSAAGQLRGDTFLHCNDTFPSPSDTVLPWMLPVGLKELRVQP
jgi:hypothetical protein